jgi:hypothetical protein
MEGVNMEGENMEGVISLGVIAGENSAMAGAGVGADGAREGDGSRVAPSTFDAIIAANTHAIKQVLDRGRFLDTELILMRLIGSSVRWTWEDLLKVLELGNRAEEFSTHDEQKRCALEKSDCGFAGRREKMNVKSHRA